MSVEAERGCGFRKVGGLYLCGEGLSMSCDRLPYELSTCPVCGSGVKFSRGFQWLQWNEYAHAHATAQPGDVCSCPTTCPVCWPHVQPQPYGLLWCGEQFYTPESFIQEALQMGVSKRIAAAPKNLKLGETWVLFAHKKAIQRFSDDPYPGTAEELPGVFYAFRPQRLELLVWQRDATDERLAELEKKGITPVIIPDGDVDHDPRTSLKPKDEERSEVFFESLRESIRGGE